jgi:teichuronic acid exporter
VGKELSSVLKWLSFIFIIAAFNQIQIALLKRNFAFKTMATRALVGIFIAGIVGIYMAFSGYGVWSLVGQQLTYELVGTVVLWTANSWRHQWQFSWQHLSELLNFSINILGFKLVNFFNQRTDSLLIGYFLGEVALGYYAITQRILQVMTQLLSGTINQVALSTFSRLQTDTSLLHKVFYQAIQFTSLIAFPTFLGMIVLTPELITVLFGKQWQPAIPITQILTFAGLLRSISIFTESIFIAMNKPAWRLYLGVLNTIFNIVACVLAVRWGIIAIAIAYILSDYMAFPFSQWAVSELIQTPVLTYLRQLIAPFVSALIMVVAILIINRTYALTGNTK